MPFRMMRVTRDEARTLMRMRTFVRMKIFIHFFHPRLTHQRGKYDTILLLLRRAAPGLVVRDWRPEARIPVCDTTQMYTRGSCHA